jgi:hypothetical protein
MLRIDKAHLRSFGDGVAEGKGCMGQHAENVPHVSRTEILDHGFCKVCFRHRRFPPYVLASLVQRDKKSNMEQTPVLVRIKLLAAPSYVKKAVGVLRQAKHERAWKGEQ